MTSEMKGRIAEMLDTEIVKKANTLDFEVAYQTRIAIDKIRFAIKQTESLSSRFDQLQGAAFQLLDALNRLESLDRLFQKLSESRHSGTSSPIDEVRRHG